MKVYNFKQLLETNGISNPEDCELYHIVDSLEAVGIKINPSGPWIAGGAVIRTFLNQPLDTDIDIFFKDITQFTIADKNIKDKATFIEESKFSKSYQCIFEHKGVERIHKIQLISFLMAEKASEIISKFDISICQIAFDGERVIMPEKTLEDIKSKNAKILVDVVSFPGSTLKRIVKYAGRGYQFSAKNLQEFADKYIVGERELKKVCDS